MSYTVMGLKDRALTALVLPTTYRGLPVTGIGQGAFRDCAVLTSVTIGNSVTDIGSYRFRDNPCELSRCCRMPDADFSGSHLTDPTGYGILLSSKTKTVTKTEVPFDPREPAGGVSRCEGGAFPIPSESESPKRFAGRGSRDCRVSA